MKPFTTLAHAVNIKNNLHFNASLVSTLRVHLTLFTLALSLGQLSSKLRHMIDSYD